jgi:nicotinamide-nucleotide amidase
MIAMPDKIGELAHEVITGLIERGATVATAESCTGGLIAGALTSVPGSSEAFYGGYVSYANDAKEQMIGVAEATLRQHGAVSERTVTEMAVGAWERSGAAYAVAVTGIAGPGGGTPGKPVGLVWFGLASGRRVLTHCMFFGDIGRDQVREKSVETALEMLLEAMKA